MNRYEIYHVFKSIPNMLFLPEIWDFGGPYCTNLEYKLVLLIYKTIWMICKSIRLVYDHRKLQKYVIMQGN